MDVNQKIIKEWRDFSAAQLHENGMLTEQLEFTVRVAQEWQARAEAAERRVAELEARLDTQEWHWGDEPPPPYDWYLVFDWDAEDLDFVAMQVVWFDGEWSCDLTHWRKLPEAPRAAWAEAHRCTSTPPPAATE